MPYSHYQSIDRAAIKRVRHFLPGAMLFAANAGYVNSVALGLFRSPVSHMSGTVSYLGLDAAMGRTADALTTAGILLAFLGGACLSGAIIGSRSLLPGRRYGVCLVLEGLFLGGATFLVGGHHRAGLPLASLACGLQNATTSSYCGMMIRTTHLTGTVTDIGVLLGHWVRGHQIEFWKLRFMVCVVVSFASGIYAGALADARFGHWALGAAAGGIATAGAAIWLFGGRGWLKQDLAHTISDPTTASFPRPP